MGDTATTYQSGRTKGGRRLAPRHTSLHPNINWCYLFMDNKKYYLFVNREKTGPFTAAEVLWKFSKELSDSKVLIWASYMKDWTPIENCITILKDEANKLKLETEAPEKKKEEPPAKVLAINPISTPPKSELITKSTNPSSYKKKLLTLSIAAAFALIASFYIYYIKYAERSVVGKVFIVQKNAEVRKLAAANIEILTKQEAEKWLAQVKPSVEQKLTIAKQTLEQKVALSSIIKSTAEKLPSKYEHASIQLDNIRLSSFSQYYLWKGFIRQTYSRSTENFDESKARALAAEDSKFSEKKAQILKEWREFTADYEIGENFVNEIDSKIKNDSWYTLKDVIRLSGFPKLKRLAQKITFETNSKLSEQKEELDGFRKATNALIKLPMFYPPSIIKREASAITDGDGQVAIKLPPGDYYVFARYSRELPSETETYFWATQFTVKASNENVFMLQNQNEAFSQDDKCLWPYSIIQSLNEIGKICDNEKKSIEAVSEFFNSKTPTRFVENKITEIEIDEIRNHE